MALLKFIYLILVLVILTNPAYCDKKKEDDVNPKSEWVKSMEAQMKKEAGQVGKVVLSVESKIAKEAVHAGKAFVSGVVEGVEDGRQHLHKHHNHHNTEALETVVS